MQLPPIIHTSDPNSWAQRTFKERIPRILEDVIAANDYPRELVAELNALRDEIVGGTIRALNEATDDRAFWDERSRAHLGKSWLEVPWYWAEAFFYRRVLEAVRYFQPGEFYRRDPYARIKRQELDRAPHALQRVLAQLPTDDSAAFHILMHATLWGNRVDLSMYNIAQAEPDHENVLIDDTLRVWLHLQAYRNKRVEMICDNAGTELLFDLTFADFLLRNHLAREIVLHLKPQPTFVSDAMIQDVYEALAVLERSGETLQPLAARLTQAMADQRLKLFDHPFWVSDLFFHDLPNDLRAMFAQASLVISKGDANYRRLIGDCHWEPTTAFELASAHFPASIVAVRTLKSEPIVGLRAGVVERLRAHDAMWNIDGRFGVIQFRKLFQSDCNLAKLVI